MICILGNTLIWLVEGLPIVDLDVGNFPIDDVDRTFFRNKRKQDGGDNNTAVNMVNQFYCHYTLNVKLNKTQKHSFEW